MIYCRLIILKAVNTYLIILLNSVKEIKIKLAMIYVVKKNWCQNIQGGWIIFKGIVL